MPLESTTLKVGDAAPRFSVITPGEERVTLEPPLARPLLILFIRGTW